MPGPYPILNNRPIDQWKVTELKEELRKRSLKINGLKEELVRRLADALRTEMEEDGKEEAEKEELGNGMDPDNDPEGKVNEEDSASMLKENSAEHISDEADEEKSVTLLPENNAEPKEDKSGQSDNDTVMVDNTDSTVDISPIANDEGQKEMGLANLDAVVEDSTDNAAPLEKSTTDSETGVVQAESSDRDTMSGEKNKDSKLSAEDAALNVPESTNQVSEVSTDLGFQVKSDSISTDSVSINEKNELKDNLNANIVHLELEVVKAEMVQPSSSDVPTVGGDSHQLEDDKELVDSHVSLEGAGDVACATDVDICKKIAGVDEGSSEKLNLDRSSGDGSMEEDVLETKQIELKNNSEEGERKDIKEDVAEVANPIDVLVSGFSPEKKDMVSEEDLKLPATVEKRKAEVAFF